jgi:predicted esterase
LAQTNGGHATGVVHLTFNQRSPFSPLPELCRREPFKSRLQVMTLNRTEEQVRSWESQNDYDLSHESFEAFIPAAYGRGDAPFGVLVFISAGDSHVPAGWAEALSKHRLIWISAEHGGNDREGLIRVGLALDAIFNISQRYNVDANRVYIAGFSGGAEKANWLLTAFPDQFAGGYLMMGSSFYFGIEDENHHWQPGVEGLRWHGPIDEIKKSTRIVILSGANDPGVVPGADRADYEALLLDGFQHAGFMQVPGGHQLPSATWFEKGLAMLDDPKPKTPPTTAPTTAPTPQPSQVAQAKRILATAQYLLKMHISWADRKAGDYLRQLMTDYPTTPSAAKAQQLLKDGRGSG